MKIVHFIESINVSYGGPAFGMSRIINNYPSGVNVTVVVTGDRYHGAEVNFTRSIELIKLDNRSSMTRYLLKQNFDLYVVHGTWRKELFLVGFYSYLKKKPSFIFAHGMLDGYFFKPTQKKWLKKVIFHNLLQCNFLLFFDKILCTSDLEAQKIVSLQRNLESRVLNVGYGINDSEIPAVISNSFELFDRYLVFMSRVHEKKGIRPLVQAYSSLTDPQFDLVICGAVNEYYETTIQPIIEFSKNRNRIHYLGQVTGERKWALLANSEYMILPSQQENFGVIIAEALAVGTPVILGEDLDIVDLITNSECGYSVTPTKEAITNLLENISGQVVDVPSTERCKATFKKHFHMKNVTDQILRLSK